MSAADQPGDAPPIPTSVSEPALIPVLAVTLSAGDNAGAGVSVGAPSGQSPAQDASSELYLESKMTHSAYLRPLSTGDTSSVGGSLSDTGSEPGAGTGNTTSGLPARPSSSLGLGARADFDDSSSCASSLATAELAALRITETNKYGRVDRYGFIIIDEHGQAIRNRLKHDDERKDWKKEREATRAVKWVEMLFCLEREGNLLKWPKTHRKFVSRLVKGIPDCIRPKVWLLFVKPQASKPPFPTLYSKISGFERQIDLDIERTLRDHVLFRTRFGQAQVSLFKILVAYSNHDPQVGYCQGMSTVAAFLLMYFDEEVSFNFLVTLMERDKLRLLFQTGFPLLFESFYCHERLLARYLPRLHARLTSFHIGTSVYATKWFLTLFLGFPFSLATRIWDMFMYFGFDYLIILSLSLLKYFEDKLMHLDYEPCMQFLSHLPEMAINETRLIRISMDYWEHYWEPGRAGRLVGMRQDYRALTAAKEAGGGAKG